MSKQHKTLDSNLNISERITLTASVVILGLSFFLFGIFSMFSWIFFLVIIVDLVILTGSKLPETITRLFLFLSLGSVVIVSYYALSVYLHG